MRWARVIALVAAVGATATAARGQDLLLPPQVLDPATAAAAAQFVVTPLDGPAPAPVGPDGRPAPVRTADILGVVGGRGVNNHADAAVGFTYLVPLWSFRAFQLAVPRGFEPFFPTFGTTGPVDSHFAYAPRVSLNYYVADLDVAVGTSGTFLNLSGQVDRQVSGTNGPSGLLTAHANLTMVSATLPEFGRRYAFQDLFPCKAEKKPGLVDSVVELRIGTRYLAVDQNYTGTVIASGFGVPGSAVSTRFSTQSFRGVGITGAAIWEIPYENNWVLFSSVRQSALIGENRRNSTVTVTVPLQPGFSDAQLDSRTAVIPVTELEVGADWGQDMAHRLREGLDPPRFVVRVAGVAQYWGGLGPLSAGSTQLFRSSDLFLVGGYIQAGFRY